MKKLVPETGRELRGSPYAAIVGDMIRYSVNMGAAATVDGNCWAKAYKGTTDTSSSVLTGSMSASGNIVTLPTIQNELAAEYRYVFKVKVGGQYIVYFFRRRVERQSGTKLI